MTSTTGPRSSHRLRGFTLIELILVMVIVCIALALVAPALRDFWRGAQTRDNALQLLAMTHWAKSQSVTGARIHALRFDAAAGTFHLEVSDGLGAEPLLNEFGRTFSLPDGCRVQVAVAPGAEQNCIRFYPNGRTDGTRILLQGPGPEQIEISVRSPTEDFELRGEENEGR